MSVSLSRLQAQSQNTIHILMSGHLCNCRRGQTTVSNSVRSLVRPNIGASTDPRLGPRGNVTRYKIFRSFPITPFYRDDFTESAILPLQLLSNLLPKWPRIDIFPQGTWRPVTSDPENPPSTAALQRSDEAMGYCLYPLRKDPSTVLTSAQSTAEGGGVVATTLWC
jgi:hypothetical protein